MTDGHPSEDRDRIDRPEPAGSTRAPEQLPAGERPPFRWTERRAARLVTILLSAAVVVADVFLFFVFLEQSGTFPEEAKRWVPAIGFGIFAIFVYAVGRVVRQVALFRRDE
ncbi:MAG: hypothetical protein ACM3JJ_07640 [Hyphomicrobiales bacterium]